ncbi:MAG TPA: TIGR02281 family clan AA aspartic protease [Gammaproteobacteria bacterium]|nr:TIGR02281 family clan AA aspartic protease [Gammaproteobacteria bacterium]
MTRRFLRNLAFQALVLLVLGSGAGRVLAVKDIHVVALFRDRAVVMIDGKRHLLGAGETSPEGVRLISADSAGAVLEYGGERLERQLDGRVRAAVKPRDTGEDVHIFRDSMGMFKTVGSINGLPVSFLVDTGASSVAMNAAQARRLGIDYHVEGEPTWVSTASDVVRAYRVRLDIVKVGSIQLRNVTAIVMEGPQPSEALLGMSYLSRVQLINQGDRLILRRRY